MESFTVLHCIGNFYIAPFESPARYLHTTHPRSEERNEGIRKFLKLQTTESFNSNNATTLRLYLYVNLVESVKSEVVI